MSGQHRHQREPLRTVRALERPLARVNAEVFNEHKAERELFAALVTLVRSLASVSGQVSLYVRPAAVRFLTMWAFKLELDLMRLPVLGARKQGVEAFAALLADVALGGDVGLPVFQEVSRRGEALAADGADLRELTLLRVGVLMVDGQRPQISEGTPTELAREGNRHAVMFAFMLCEIP